RSGSREGESAVRQPGYFLVDRVDADAGSIGHAESPAAQAKDRIDENGHRDRQQRTQEQRQEERLGQGARLHFAGRGKQTRTDESPGERVRRRDRHADERRNVDGKSSAQSDSKHELRLRRDRIGYKTLAPEGFDEALGQNERQERAGERRDRRPRQG